MGRTKAEDLLHMGSALEFLCYPFQSQELPGV